MSKTPVTPVAAADHQIYAVAGGNHVTIELDRAMTGGLLDVMSRITQPRSRKPRLTPRCELIDADRWAGASLP